MQLRKYFKVTFFVMGLLILGLSTPALAKKKAKSKHQLKDTLGKIEWGDSRVTVLKKLKASMFEKIKKDPKLKKDRLKMQVAHKGVLDKYAAIERSKTSFRGKRTGYEVSIIADEYTKNNNESMILVKDKYADRYYFFMDGRFYKMLVGYDRGYLKGVSFENFVAQTMKRYGRPKDIEYGEIFGEEELAQARWMDGATILSLHNKREFFGTYTMVFSDRKRVKSLNASGRKFGGKGKAKKGPEKVSSSVAALTKSNARDKNKDIVNSMVGDVNIDLNEGRPEDEKIREEEKTTVAAATKKAKKTKKRAKKKRAKKRKKRDFSKIDAGDKELVIY